MPIIEHAVAGDSSIDGAEKARFGRLREAANFNSVEPMNTRDEFRGGIQNSPDPAPE